MATGFRKSVFGFNCQDVMNYIESTHKNFVSKQNELNKKIDDATALLEEQESENSLLNEEILKLKAELKEYADKKEETERLSRNIGRLYLVAQSNANAIMQRAKEMRFDSEQLVKNNVDTIDDAQISLNELRQKIDEMSKAFTSQMDELVASLSATKEKIADNRNLDNADEKEFEKLYISAKI